MGIGKGLPPTLRVEAGRSKRLGIFSCETIPSGLPSSTNSYLNPSPIVVTPLLVAHSQKISFRANWTTRGGTELLKIPPKNVLLLSLTGGLNCEWFQML